RSPRDPAGHDRGRAVRVRHWAAAADSRGEHREARSARAGAGAAGGDRVGQRPRRTVPLTPGWEWGLIPAVPVPFRGRVLAEDAPVGYHAALGRELPVIAFYLYEAAGGVAYDNQTLHAILALPSVMGIKVATLDSVVTFQRIAGLMRHHPDKLLITGEDRFLG